MTRVPITIACGDYDRTRPIQDGRVAIEGCEVTYLRLPPEEILYRAVHYNEFEVSELSASSYLIQTATGESNYIAIPVFVSRVFRHSGIYIRTDRGIETPEDLKGRIVGIPEYQITLGLWVRGMLQDDHGVKPSDIRWRNGGQEEPGRVERTPLDLPDDVELESIPLDKTLSDMLEAGEIDALFGARAPSCFRRGAPNVGRLYPDFRAVEQAYYRRTGLFPIMWLIGIRKDMVERYPWLPANVYRAFVEAKRIAMERLEAINALEVTLPWLCAEVAATKQVMGDDYWPYGIAENAKDIEAMTRYAYQQGLTDRLLAAEDLFAPSTFTISKV